MVTVVVSSREPKQEFEDHLIKTSGLGKNIEVIQFKNNGEYSLTEIYNKGLKQAKNDVIVFCHDDITINRSSWGHRLLKNFNNNPEYGILGVAGTKTLDGSGTWWANRARMCGRVAHRDVKSGKTWDSNFSKDQNDKLTEVVVLDGVFFAVDRTKIKSNFDESVKGFHFYDISFTLENYIKGVKIGVFTNIKITHDSIGQTNKQWEENRKEFAEKYKAQLPQSIKCDIPVDEFETTIENQPKLALIIPTKDKYELISGCLNSILTKTKYDNYIIYVADTGSTEDVKNNLKTNYLDEYPDKVRMIEYDYYNYAKINNDVVVNHIDKDTELIIFCNNDIEMINDSLSIMVDTYIKNKEKVGTVGCRLHFEDGTVQHMGILAYNQKRNNQLILTHNALGYDFNDLKETTTDTINIYGNTAAFVLISKEQFLKYGMFNEGYEICFEDVELNFKAMLDGKVNMTCTNAVNYHFESQTRGKEISQNDYRRIVEFTYNTGLIKHIKEI